MTRVKSQAWLEADQNGSRRRQSAALARFKSGSATRPKTNNKTKRRRRDSESPEKD